MTTTFPSRSERKVPTGTENVTADITVVTWPGGRELRIDRRESTAIFDGKQLHISEAQVCILHDVARGLIVRAGDYRNHNFLQALRKRLSVQSDLGITLIVNTQTLVLGQVEYTGHAKLKPDEKREFTHKIDVLERWQRPKTTKYELSEWERMEVLRLQAKRVPVTAIAAILRVPNSAICEAMTAPKALITETQTK